MPPLPAMSGKEVMKVFVSAGYELDRNNGSHHILVKEGCLPLTVPIHGNKDLKPGTLRRIIRDSGLSVSEFCALSDKK